MKDALSHMNASLLKQWCSWPAHSEKLSLGSGVSSPKEKTAGCNSLGGERIKITRMRTKQFRTKINLQVQYSSNKDIFFFFRYNMSD